jgi:hypothetical protein
MKLHSVLFPILFSVFITTNGLSQQDTCVVLIGSPLNPSAAAATNIRQAVAGGMGYFGTCGGTLIAVEITPTTQ